MITPQDHQIELIESSQMLKASPGVTIDEGGFFTDLEPASRSQKMLNDNQGRTLSSVDRNNVSKMNQDSGRVPE